MYVVVVNGHGVTDRLMVLILILITLILMILTMTKTSSRPALDLVNFYFDEFDNFTIFKILTKTSSRPASALGSRPELGRFGNQDQMSFDDLTMKR